MRRYSPSSPMPRRNACMTRSDAQAATDGQEVTAVRPGSLGSVVPPSAKPTSPPIPAQSPSDLLGQATPTAGWAARQQKRAAARQRWLRGRAVAVAAVAAVAAGCPAAAAAVQAAPEAAGGAGENCKRVP